MYIQSSYSIALYELLKSHAFKEELIISIEDLRYYLVIEDNYRYAMAEINGIHHIPGQLNLFE